MPNLDQNFFALDGGIIQEYLPGNIINANLKGYTTFLNKNTPANFAAYSLQQYAQQTVPDVIEVVPNPGQNERQATTKADEDFKNRLDTLLGIFGVSGLAMADQITPGLSNKNAVTKPTSTLCEGMNNDGIIPYLTLCTFATESGKRIGLVVVGVLLIALGVWSLR